MTQILLCWVQGFYFLITGIWPLVHMKSFQAITGPKNDDWLVRTVGILVSVCGAVLLYSAVHEAIPAETVVLAVGAALGLTAIDVIYATSGRISKIYYLDAVLELLLVGGWLVADR